ncbi:hypothetical protein VNO78_28966 [Psophocarpus tetragonolobus]|uniref:Secreted protein n=1 Tax=Psophocarpus tetragonolobus TaxID=3891 RepID=A0AAN9WZW5_PSOTE
MLRTSILLRACILHRAGLLRVLHLTPSMLLNSFSTLCTLIRFCSLHYSIPLSCSSYVFRSLCLSAPSLVGPSPL